MSNKLRPFNVRFKRCWEYEVWATSRAEAEGMVLETNPDEDAETWSNIEFPQRRHHRAVTLAYQQGDSSVDNLR